MANLPTNRTTANTPAEHVDDHNTLHAFHNLIDAKGDLIVGTAADTAGKKAVGTDGQVLTADASVAGGIKWAAPSGTSVTGYHPDMAPSSPHANDDEFNNASLGGAWTEWDGGSLITVTEGDFGLKLAHASSSGNNRYGGIFRAIPAGDFTVITKLSHCFTTSAGPNAGVFVAADLAAAPTTADFHAFVLGLSSNQTFLGAHLYNDYTSFNSTLNSAQFGPTHAYMRIRRVSTLFSFDFSTDGVAWLRFTTFTPSYTPASIGLTINNSSAIANSAYYRFWRQSADTALDAPLLGRNL